VGKLLWKVSERLLELKFVSRKHKHETLIKQKSAGGMAQVVGCLPTKHHALSSNTITKTKLKQNKQPKKKPTTV
jgi:pyruvate/2-oxoglutarate dehydrogenase complex dihydrolipoamide dehydrogenase (E3) component